jgi:hypothetical protein
MAVFTLFMFFLSTAHIVMVMRYANIQYLEKNAAIEGSKVLQHRGEILVYIPVLLEVTNVSFCICNQRITFLLIYL